MVHGVHLTWGYLGETVKKKEKSKAVLAIVASAKSEKPAQGLAMPEGPAQDPDQPSCHRDISCSRRRGASRSCSRNHRKTSGSPHWRCRRTEQTPAIQSWRCATSRRFHFGCGASSHPEHRLDRATALEQRSCGGGSILHRCATPSLCSPHRSHRCGGTCCSGVRAHCGPGSSHACHWVRSLSYSEIEFSRDLMCRSNVTACSFFWK